MQLADAGVPFVHTVELLDWATGGPAPEALGAAQGSGHAIEALVELAKRAPWSTEAAFERCWLTGSMG